MKVVTKHYIEMFYPRGQIPESFDTSIIQISERNPLLVGSSDIISHFRFFDREIVRRRNSEDSWGERKNISPIFYFGKCISAEKIKNWAQNDTGFFSLAEHCEQRGISSIIVCNCGCIIKNPSDGIMIDEQPKKLKKLIR